MSETDRLVQERRIQKLKDERQKVLDGYYAGAIPLDLLKTEQDRIGRGLAQGEERLGRLTGQFDHIEEVITRAMAWVDSLHEAYQAASDQVRRLLNQALYTQVFVNADGVVRVIHTDGFGWLLGEEEQDEASEDREATRAGQNDVRVEAEVVVRFERTARHNDMRPGWRAGALARGSVDHGWNVKRLVELEGIEPSSARCRLPVLRPFPRGGPNAVLVPGHELLVTSLREVSRSLPTCQPVFPGRQPSFCSQGKGSSSACPLGSLFNLP